MVRVCSGGVTLRFGATLREYRQAERKGKDSKVKRWHSGVSRCFQPPSPNNLERGGREVYVCSIVLLRGTIASRTYGIHKNPTRYRIDNFSINSLSY